MLRDLKVLIFLASFSAQSSEWETEIRKENLKPLKESVKSSLLDTQPVEGATKRNLLLLIFLRFIKTLKLHTITEKKNEMKDLHMTHLNDWQSEDRKVLFSAFYGQKLEIIWSKSR